ncbi:MAG: hypothetical protein ACTH6N_04055 [Brachybacterium tyrofermentans]|uniref:hypothetical protein n=2 Tax=Brachybacterium tyrofermentans TaxID=47848 RepID=UPI0018696574|nr:hypothetical protein [Brachybacterium tyrofermentans]
MDIVETDQRANLVSTAGERIEATVWLESNSPDLTSQQRANFLSAVDTYYEEDPVAERTAGPLGCIRQDERKFAEILRKVLGEVPPSPPSPSFDLP